MVKSHGIIRENLIIDKCSADNVMFRIVSDNVQQYDVITGRNFFDLPHVAYLKVDDRLECLNREEVDFRSDIFVHS